MRLTLDHHTTTTTAPLDMVFHPHAQTVFRTPELTSIVFSFLPRGSSARLLRVNSAFFEEGVRYVWTEPSGLSRALSLMLAQELPGPDESPIIDGRRVVTEVSPATTRRTTLTTPIDEYTAGRDKHSTLAAVPPL